MPSKSMRPCSQPGCGKLTKAGRCEAHQAKAKEQRKQYDTERGNSAQRGYDAQWRKFRVTYLRQHPLCISCHDRGRLVEATEIHHVKMMSDGGSKYDESNLIAYCKRCHSSVTSKEVR